MGTVRVVVVGRGGPGWIITIANFPTGSGVGSRRKYLTIGFHTRQTLHREGPSGTFCLLDFFETNSSLQPVPLLAELRTPPTATSIHSFLPFPGRLFSLKDHRTPPQKAQCRTHPKVGCHCQTDPNRLHAVSVSMVSKTRSALPRLWSWPITKNVLPELPACGPRYVSTFNRRPSPSCSSTTPPWHSQD